ncbi:hypothetical protein IQ250_00045 [Pseudanabaenaceae cyanobacterium LEGE 13415]|nr:hypothetical protein [Pseudanabaenaceae cyanobacterium LEGE 13415]
MERLISAILTYSLKVTGDYLGMDVNVSIRKLGTMPDFEAAPRVPMVVSKEGR